MSVLLRTLYRDAGILLAPLITAYLHKRARRGKEDPARLRERFGHASVARPPGNLVWIHAASVGEVQSVLTLVERLSDRADAPHLLITTGTVTSAAMLAARHLPRVIHQFVPVDTASSVRRFLDHWQPDLALWVESEFWPELLYQTQGRGIPTMLINARISARSAARWQRLRSMIAPLVDGFVAVFPSTPDDALRLQQLGTPHIVATGNLKFDAAALPADTAALSALNAATAGRPMVLAASTHDGEEALIARACATIRTRFPALLCIIVPRHATRGDGITTMLRATGANVAQRSRDEAITAATQYYIADTMGELGLFYRACDIVCIGGSFVPHGGHNVLEPAQLRCTIITGPHMHNFADMTARMHAAHALIIADDEASLAQACEAMLADSEKQLNLADNAWQFVQESQGAADHIMATIAPYLTQKTQA